MRYSCNLLFPFLTAVLLSGPIAGCAGEGTKQSTGEYLDDSVITTRVKAAFVADSAVSALDIKVTTLNGVVQLSGFANSDLEIDRAVELAKGVPGVKSVKNDIRRERQGAGAYFDDSAITARVMAAFVADKEVSALDIKVETNNGVVLLSGFANSREGSERAVQIARNVEGVKSVENHIRLK
jgi:hyperosmotically inducible protein